MSVNTPASERAEERLVGGMLVECEGEDCHTVVFGSGYCVACEAEQRVMATALVEVAA